LALYASALSVVVGVAAVAFHFARIVDVGVDVRFAYRNRSNCEC
jgi:hypothetical protein